jgi:Down syndrome cell adhesion molecule-like protein 1
MEDEICPYATFHLLGFREEMDPNKAMNFQTFPHQNGHGGHAHSRNSSQSMVCFLNHFSILILNFNYSSQPRANGRYSRVNGPNSAFSPEYDDPANCEPEEDQYGSQYGPYGAPYDHYGSRNSVSRRSVGEYFIFFELT